MKRIIFILTMTLIAFVGVNNVDAMRADVVAYGTSGDCGWILYEDGDMHIGTHLSDLDDPNEPNSCILGGPIEIVDIGSSHLGSPWEEYVDDVKSISFSGTVYANVNSSNLFSELYNLTSIDLSGFITNNVTDMSFMFSGTGLTSLNLSSFDTSKVTNMTGMFIGSSSLVTLNLSSFDTRNVTDMSFMFSDTGLTQLDLSSFDTANVTSVSFMFAGSSSLSRIIVSDSFVTSSVIIGDGTSEDVFYNCVSLVGGNGTVYDSNHVGVDYAVVDTSTNPGYFTSNKIIKNINTAVVTGIKNQIYNGKQQRQTSIVVTLNGEVLEKNVDYQILYDKLINAGTIKMTIKGIGDYEGTLVKTFIRKKAKNTLTVKAYNKTVYYSKVKKAAQVVKPITIVKKQGTLTYTKLSGSSTKLLLNKTTGKVTVKKGTKKGKYKIRIKVSASGNTNYFSNYGIKTIYVTVK